MRNSPQPLQKFRPSARIWFGHIDLWHMTYDISWYDERSQVRFVEMSCLDAIWANVISQRSERGSFVYVFTSFRSGSPFRRDSSRSHQRTNDGHRHVGENGRRRVGRRHFGLALLAHAGNGATQRLLRLRRWMCNGQCESRPLIVGQGLTFFQSRVANEIVIYLVPVDGKPCCYETSSDWVLETRWPKISILCVVSTGYYGCDPRFRLI